MLSSTIHEVSCCNPQVPVRRIRARPESSESRRFSAFRPAACRESTPALWRGTTATCRQTCRGR